MHELISLEVCLPRYNCVLHHITTLITPLLFYSSQWFASVRSTITVCMSLASLFLWSRDLHPSELFGNKIRELYLIFQALFYLSVPCCRALIWSDCALDSATLLTYTRTSHTTSGSSFWYLLLEFLTRFESRLYILPTALLIAPRPLQRCLPV